MCSKLSHWQRKENRSAFTGVSLSPGPPAVTGHHPPDSGEANSCAFKLVDAVEALENPEELVGVLGVEAHTVVTDHKHRLSRIHTDMAHLNHRRVAWPRVLDRVLKKVGQDLAEHGRVARDPRKSRQTPVDPPPLGFPIEACSYFRGERVKVHHR